MFSHCLDYHVGDWKVFTDITDHSTHEKVEADEPHEN